MTPAKNHQLNEIIGHIAMFDYYLFTVYDWDIATTRGMHLVSGLIHPSTSWKIKPSYRTLW